MPPYGWYLPLASRTGTSGSTHSHCIALDNPTIEVAHFKMSTSSNGSKAPNPPNALLYDGALYQKVEKVEKTAEAIGRWKRSDRPEQAVADSERVSRYLETSETVLEGVEQAARYLELSEKAGSRPLLDVNRDGEEEEKERKWAALVHNYETQLQLIPKPVAVQAATEARTSSARVYYLSSIS